MKKVIPQRYPKQTKEELIAQIIEKGWLDETNISARELNSFAQQPDSRAFYGKSLYPRFYKKDRGEHSTGRDAYDNKDFSRLAFSMIGAFGQTGAILPLPDSPAYFPDATDVILIGCQHNHAENYLYPYIDAFIVIVLDEDKMTLYTSGSFSSLQCSPPPV